MHQPGIRDRAAGVSCPRARRLVCGSAMAASRVRKLHHDFDYAVAEAGLVCVRATMRARHVGPFVLYTPEGDVDEAFPPTGKEFVVTQTYWLRLEDSKVIEHWANRDDLAMAKQAGWVPPTPVYLLKMALARRRAKHELAASLKNMPPG